MFSRDPNCHQLPRARLSKINGASRRGKKVLNCSRDKNGGVYRSGEGGKKRLLGGPGPESRLRRDKEKEKLRRQWLPGAFPSPCNTVTVFRSTLS